MPPPGPRGIPRSTQTITWMIHRIIKVTENGNMLAIIVPRPTFSSYLRAKPSTTGIYVNSGDRGFVMESPIRYTTWVMAGS